MSHFINILVAYDGSEMSREALRTAAALTPENGELRIVTVWQLPPMPYEGASAYDIGQFQEASMRYAQELVDEAADQVKDSPFKVIKEVLSGHPATQILAYAEGHDIDLIVIGSRGLNTIKRFFLGSVSQRVIQEADCDVLVIK